MRLSTYLFSPSTSELLPFGLPPSIISLSYSIYRFSCSISRSRLGGTRLFNSLNSYSLWLSCFCSSSSWLRIICTLSSRMRLVLRRLLTYMSFSFSARLIFEN